MLVLDANILIRAILGKRVRLLLEKYADRGARFYAPEVAFADAEKYLPALLRKRGKPTDDLPAAINYLRSLVEALSNETFAGYETAARQRLRGRDEEDWPILAASISLACGVWTEDTDFFGAGVAVWTTDRVELFLIANTERPISEDE
jgi:predicted nucleic acid-binding protein